MSKITTTPYTIPASKAKQNFGELLDNAQREPVTIEKNGRAVAVVMSKAEYDRIEALEDAHWVVIADKAVKEGFIGVTKSEKLLRKILNEKA